MRIWPFIFFLNNSKNVHLFLWLVANGCSAEKSRKWLATARFSLLWVMWNQQCLLRCLPSNLIGCRWTEWQCLSVIRIKQGRFEKKFCWTWPKVLRNGKYSWTAWLFPALKNYVQCNVIYNVVISIKHMTLHMVVHSVSFYILNPKFIADTKCFKNLVPKLTTCWNCCVRIPTTN